MKTLVTEFYTRSNIFENCQEAIRTTLKDLRSLKARVEKESTLNATAYTNVIDDFLALSIQFEMNPTKQFEHFPRLAKDYAKEALQLFTYDIQPEAQKEFIELYIQNFRDEKFHEIVRG